MSGAMSRRKGGRAEADAVNYLRAHGHPHAERRGSGFDTAAGDIIGIPGVVLEIKNHATLDLAGWVDQLTVELDHRQGCVGAVIHKRRGRVNVGDWYATMPVHVLLGLLADAGYGTDPGPGSA